MRKVGRYLGANHLPGPIVRISPFELHIRDPPYHQELYRFGAKWERYGWAVSAHDIPTSALFTVDHDLHKQRRASLNSYFSKNSIAKRMGLIRTSISAFCSVIDDAAASDRVLDIGAGVSAWQRDVALDFLIDEHPNDLGKPDLAKAMTTFIEGATKMWRITKHLPWYGPMMKAIPKDFLIKHSSDVGLVAWAKRHKASRPMNKSTFL